MKRILLVTILLFGATSVFAQEKAAEKATEKAEETHDEMLVWKWANFAILAGFAGYMAMKHLPPYFKSRSAEIQKDITDAQEQKKSAEKRAAEMDVRLSTLGAEIEKFRVEAKAQMEQEAARIRQETAQQIEKYQRQAEQEIESAGNIASRQLSAYAAKLALDLAEQRIRTRLDGGTESGLIEDFTNDLQRMDPRQGSKN